MTCRQSTTVAFRIFQEAVNDTLRHDGPATAAVTVDYGESAVRVEVTDTGLGLTGSPPRRPSRRSSSARASPGRSLPPARTRAPP